MPTCLVLTRAKIKSRSGIKVKVFASQLCFSLWNSSVTPGRNMLSEELECGHEESWRNVLLE